MGRHDTHHEIGLVAAERFEEIARRLADRMGGDGIERERRREA